MGIVGFMSGVVAAAAGALRGARQTLAVLDLTWNSLGDAGANI
jgi:hypothetical protein